MQSARLIGGAGTGKTTELVEIVMKVVLAGVDPLEVGYFSFTRAAREEAAKRVAEAAGIEQRVVEQHGWFRTLHSLAFRVLGATKSAILTDDKSSRAWFAERLSIGVSPGGEEDQPFRDCPWEASQAYEATALSLWDIARNRLTTLEEERQRMVLVKPESTPPEKLCRDFIDKYESAKLLDDRMDFTDLLARFGGWKFRHDSTPEQRRPEGEIPNLPALILDEAQDLSALSMSVFRRLCEESGVRWVYAAGDPWQSVYSWCGADARYFMDLPVDKQRISAKSWRCPAPILALGEKTLKQLNGAYFDRHIAPADHDGKIEKSWSSPAELIHSASEEWLLLARTNRQAAILAGKITAAGLPWRPTRGRGGFDAPARMMGLAALKNLEDGAPVNGDEWRRICELLPTKAEDGALLEHGTKARFEDAKEREKYVWVLPAEIGELGATEKLINAIRRKTWPTLLKDCKEQAEVVRKWGIDACLNPSIRIGTVHSAKGQEADNVCLMTGSTYAIDKACGFDKAAFEEEVRVAYVGVTRARKKLVLLEDAKSRFRMPIP